jgi:hypothetical protein
MMFNWQKSWTKFLLISLLLIGSAVLGQGIARATDTLQPSSIQPSSVSTPLPIAQVNPSSPNANPLPSPSSNLSASQRAIQEVIANTPTTDLIPKRYEQSLQVYFANCSTCHLAIPAELLPRQTWQRLLENTNQHYGAELPSIPGIEVTLMWRYLGTFAKSAAIEDRIPFLLRDSRFFKALHPGVRFPEPAKVTTCISCHPSAAEFNFRRLQES